MESLSHTVITSADSSVGSQRCKRQKTEHRHSYSSNIPREIVDNTFDKRPWVVSFTEIFPSDDLTSWGPPHIAATRALLEPETTPDNVRLLRSNHPAFANSVSVWILCERSGRRIWVLRDGAASAYVYAGGLEVHQAPSTKYAQTNAVFPWKRDLIRRHINPRAALSDSDLELFRSMFPLAIGVRIYIAGCVVVLYKSAKALYNDLGTGVAYKVGGFHVQFDVLDLVPSSTDEPDMTAHNPTTEIGGPIVDEPSATTPTACIGVRLRLPDGQSAITTVTHGFVHHPTGDNRLFRFFDWFWAETRALLRYRAPPITTAELPLVMSKEKVTSTFGSNTSIGKEVWLMTTGKRIGTIQVTFDEPSAYLPYPKGYRCDLSLILPSQTGNIQSTLPWVDPAAGMPAVDGWGDLGAALSGAPVFVAANLIHDAGRTVRTGVSLTPTDKHAFFEDILAQKRQALIEGTQYIWDNETHEQNGSLLWRTEVNSEDGPVQLLGFSGSLLCLGRPNDLRAKALLFQNFQVPYPSPRIGNEVIRPQDRASWNVKGGFFLPECIRACQIEMSELIRHTRG